MESEVQEWVTSDLHFFHRNVLQYCPRRLQFMEDDSVEEMNRVIIERINQVVLADDNLYILGDITIGKKASLVLDLLCSLNGNKTVVLGNHDHSIRAEQVRFEREGIRVREALMFKRKYPNLMPGYNGSGLIVMNHFPMISWENSRYGAVMLHGHLHGGSRFPNGLTDRDVLLSERIFDVGIDTHPEFKPYNLAELVVKLRHLPVAQNDKKTDLDEFANKLKKEGVTI